MKRFEYIQTGQEAREFDRIAIQEYKIPSLILMEHAALESIKEIKKYISLNQNICILCGPGNNGGDGIAIARNLYKEGILSNLYLPVEEKMSIDEKIQFDSISKLSIPYTTDIEQAMDYISHADVIIDCLFGNGLSRNIEGKYAQLIQKVNDTNAYTISIDIPSGIHATTGKMLGCAIQANLTIALDCFKEGHVIQDGIMYCGQLVSVDIGIPDHLHTHYYVNEDLISSILPKRSNQGHKGTYKRGLMIGGSQSMHGAITLAARACYQSGIGTLTLMIPQSIGDIIAKKMDFAMNLRMKDKDGFFDQLNQNELMETIQKYNIVSVGNGMGQNQETIHIVKSVLSTNVPAVIDADGIWALKDQRECLNRDAITILTPHIKEMSYLCDDSVKEILSHPFDTVKKFCQTYPNCIVVLKSSMSIIGYQDQIYAMNRPNSALAKGGSGDILCGIVTGLCGQTDDYMKAVVCACYIHSKSAEMDKDPASVQPDDCIDHISNVFQELRKKADYFIDSFRELMDLNLFI